MTNIVLLRYKKITHSSECKGRGKALKTWTEAVGEDLLDLKS